MKKNSLLAGIAAAALATVMADGARAQEGLGPRIIKAISAATSDHSADDHVGPAGDHVDPAGDPHY